MNFTTNLKKMKSTIPRKLNNNDDNKSYRTSVPAILVQIFLYSIQ